MSVLCCGNICGGRPRMQCSGVMLHAIHQREATLIQISVTAGGKNPNCLCFPASMAHLTCDIGLSIWGLSLNREALKLVCSLLYVLLFLTPNPFPLSTSLKAIASSSSPRIISLALQWILANHKSWLLKKLWLVFTCSFHNQNKMRKWLLWKKQAVKTDAKLKVLTPLSS